MSRDTDNHFMWPVFLPKGTEFHEECAQCSCGFLQRDSTWLDDVMLSDIAYVGAHPWAYVIAYPAQHHDQTTGGVKLVSGRTWVDLIGPDLRQLLEHPDLPEEFRRAAAVHLQR